ncbi:uncharacterized protein DS421_15g504760 [Arachis hypogaea]|nr:uncharacterized protein DS421_15g504760 [Arachis hypogaea]
MVHLPGKSSALGKSFGQELWFPFLSMCCARSLVTREQSSLQELESSWQELYLSLRSLVQILGGALVELIFLAQEKPPKSCFFEVPGSSLGEGKQANFPWKISGAQGLASLRDLVRTLVSENKPILACFPCEVALAPLLLVMGSSLGECISELFFLDFLHGMHEKALWQELQSSLPRAWLLIPSSWHARKSSLARASKLFAKSLALDSLKESSPQEL